MALPKHDLTGRKFGELTVICKDTPYRTPSGIPFARWVCRCKCGKTKSIRATHLLNGKTKSCGCLKQEYLATTKRKTNEYVVLDEYTKVFVSSSEYFLIDTDDIDKIKDLYWSFDSAGYAINVKTKKRLHTFLTNCPEGMCVDHISGDVKDNRRRNLRICTSQQNSWNKHESPNNKTGVIGVHRNAKGKYIAQICVNKHTYHLGTFNSLEDAAVLAAVRDDNIEPLRALTYETKGKLPSSDEVMWAIAHKLCCNITSMPQKLKDKSRKWLEEHGYKAEIW